MAKKYLLEATAGNPDIEITEVDILGSPRQCIRDGIRMVPTISIGSEKLSGIYLNRKEIESFIAQNKS